MTPDLHPCAHCSTPLPASVTVCPSCDAHSDGLSHTTVRLGKTASLLGLTVALTGCIGGVQAAYGVPIQDTGGRIDSGPALDADGDGSPDDEDCDDDNASVYPGAPETPGDKLDSNCDGNDDT